MGMSNSFGASSEYKGVQLRGDETFVVDFRKSFTPSVTAGSNEPTITRSGTAATILDYNGDIVAASANEGRIIGANRTGAGAYSDLGSNGNRIQPGINRGNLVEASRTNDVQHSDDIANAWWSTAAASPSTGTNVAGRAAQGYIADGTSGVHAIAKLFTVTGSQTHTLSGFFAPGDKDWVFMKILELTQFSGAVVFFNVADGVIGTKEILGGGVVVDATINKVNGGYRCTMSVTIGSDTSASTSWGPSGSDGAEEFTGDSSTVNCWMNGIQMELNELVQSSLIPTSGSAVTRPDDLIEYDIANYTEIGSLAGEFYFEYNPSVSNKANSLYTFQLEGNDTTNSTRVHINGTGIVQFVLFNNLDKATIFNGPTLTESGSHKFAVAWGGTDHGLYVGGVAATLVTGPFSTPTKASMDKFYMGSRSTTGSAHDQFADCNLAYLLKYDTRLSNADLKTLST